jgi:hypothetical protein
VSTESAGSRNTTSEPAPQVVTVSLMTGQATTTGGAAPRNYPSADYLSADYPSADFTASASRPATDRA